MSNVQDHGHLRKGTKSCTECRRRKIRCIRSSNEASICRSCEDRGTACNAQVLDLRPVQSPRLPSRLRFSQLEFEVATLKKVVQALSRKIGGPTSLLETSAASELISEAAVDNEDSSDSDAFTAEQPPHMQSLFQNDLLTVDSLQHGPERQSIKAKTSDYNMGPARYKLQQLIPSTEEVADIVNSVSSWLAVFHAFIPQPLGVRSQQEILDCYNSMREPDVDVISLASWLLDVAVMAQQLPEKPSKEATKAERRRSVLTFCRAVSDAVEGFVICHDRLMGTTAGLGMGMHYIRLQMSQGYIQKAWVRLRHFTAIAELVGMPKAFNAVARRQVTRTGTSEAQTQSSQIWDLMCSADRCLSMLIGLPASTQRFQRIGIQTIVVDGFVQPQAYLRRLADISAKVQGLDDFDKFQGPPAGLLGSALEIEREMKMLASQTPRSWWEIDVVQVRPDHIVQVLHYYLMMRIHLPFVTRRARGEELIYSHLACMEACEAVARRYCYLRQLLPSGLFLSPILDLQAFTATVVLLLTSNDSPSPSLLDLHATKKRLEPVVAEVISVMGEKAKETTGSNFARQGAAAVRSLNALLQDDTAEGDHHLKLQVPLLGTIQVRRNVPSTYQTSATRDFHHPYDGHQPTEFSNSRAAAATGAISGGLATQVQTDFQWDPSWFVDDEQDNFLQGAFMVDDFDDLA